MRSCRPSGWIAALVACLASAVICPAALAGDAGFRVFQPAEEMPGFVFRAEDRQGPLEAKNLHLAVKLNSPGKPPDLAGMKVLAELRFTVSGENGRVEWAVGPDECMTPEVFGASFHSEGYDRTGDLVCVISGDGGNFALRPRFKEDGSVAGYLLKVHLAGKAGDGYSGLRVDVGPQERMTNPDTLEPRFHELVPARPPLDVGIVFRPAED